MDNKTKFIELWKAAGGEVAEKGTLKKIAEQLGVPEGTIRRWKSEYIKKNKMNVQRTFGERSVKNERSQEESKSSKLEVQKQIIKYNGKLNDKEIMELSGTPKTTYYRYKNELLEYMSKMSQELLEDAVKYAYPDKEHLIKRLLGERRNILITAISNIKKTPVDKDYQQGISKSIENINKVLDTIFKDMGILRYEDLLKYLEEEKESIKHTKLSDILEEEKWQYHH